MLVDLLIDASELPLQRANTLVHLHANIACQFGRCAAQPLGQHGYRSRGFRAAGHHQLGQSRLKTRCSWNLRACASCFNRTLRRFLRATDCTIQLSGCCGCRSRKWRYQRIPQPRHCGLKYGRYNRDCAPGYAADSNVNWPFSDRGGAEHSRHRASADASASSRRALYAAGTCRTHAADTHSLSQRCHNRCCAGALRQCCRHASGLCGDCCAGCYTLRYFLRKTLFARCRQWNAGLRKKVG